MPEAIRGFLATQPSTHAQIEQPGFDRVNTPYRGQKGWMTNRVSGVFCVKETQDFEFKFLQEPSPNNWQTAYLFLDNRMVLGGPITSKTIGKTKKESLAKGPHRLEILVQDNSENSKVIVGCRKVGQAVSLPLAAQAGQPVPQGTTGGTPAVLRGFHRQPEAGALCHGYALATRGLIRAHRGRTDEAGPNSRPGHIRGTNSRAKRASGRGRGEGRVARELRR